MDMYYTLLDPGSPTHVEQLAGAFGAPVARVKAVMDVYQPGYELGNLMPTSRMRKLADNLGRESLTDAQLGDLISLENRACRAAATVYPQVAETLQRLRSMGFKLGILSNANPIGIYIAQELGLIGLVDQTFFSCELGLAKPNIKAYTKAAQLLGVPRRRCIFVGDGAGNELDGARHADMKPLRVHPWAQNDSTNPSLAQYPVVETIADLPEFIRNRLMSI
jgi:putative hydrolase of the HAD superfamily